MRFWDSSALIPMCLKEPMSETVKRLAMEDEAVAVWWGARVECVSAMARRQREGKLSMDGERRARAVLVALAAEWSEIQPTDRVRQRAERLLMVHPLRTADALQLAAALLWTGENPWGAEIVCLDHNLREAALKEGFAVLP